MAKDILDAIRQAEDDAKKREVEAAEAAQKRIDNAKVKAKLLISEAQAKADKEAEAHYESTRVDGENELIKGRKAADTKCAEIKESADKNRDSVVKKAVDFILS